MIPTQPIGSGGGRLAVLETGGFTVDETRYPRGLELTVHQHDRANICIVLEGALTERVGRRERACESATVIVKPQGETHDDRFHRHGARCLNIAVEHDRLAYIREVLPALTEVQFEADPTLFTVGHRICTELSEADDLAPLAVEGLALELITGTIRAARRGRSRAPEWIDEARDFLHANFSARVGLAALSATVGRHPAHVAQHFRRRFGVTIGEYVRRLRVAHVARRLVSSRDPLAVLAAEAGFADQSHMQRTFKARVGLTPAAYRRANE